MNSEKQIALSILASPGYAALSEAADIQRVAALFNKGTTADDLSLFAMIVDAAKVNEADPQKIVALLRKLAEVE